jgi:hypothetical protein
MTATQPPLQSQVNSQPVQIQLSSSTRDAIIACCAPLPTYLLGWVLYRPPSEVKPWS